MQSIDSKVFALITLATLVLVGLAKKTLPKLVKGREAAIAVLLPVLFTIGARAAGWFTETSWVDALMWAFSSGAASGIVHDKITDPLTAAVLSKKPPTT